MAAAAFASILAAAPTVACSPYATIGIRGLNQVKTAAIVGHVVALHGDAEEGFSGWNGYDIRVERVIYGRDVPAVIRVDQPDSCIFLELRKGQRVVVAMGPFDYVSNESALFWVVEPDGSVRKAESSDTLVKHFDPRDTQRPGWEPPPAIPVPRTESALIALLTGLPDTATASSSVQRSTWWVPATFALVSLASITALLRPAVARARRSGWIWAASSNQRAPTRRRDH